MALNGNEYRVKLPIFEGPFELLLHLVKINEMEITDVSLARLTAQYLEYLELMREMDLDVAGEFLVVAATLIQIKARYLLPSDGDEEDIEEEEIDEVLSARELMQKLIEYRSYKEIVATLKDLEESSRDVFYRHRLPDFVGPDSDEGIVTSDVQLLFDAMADVLRYVEKRDPHTELFERYKVEDKIEYLEAALAGAKELDVTREFQRCLNKVEVIVTFLALLELVRLRHVRVVQPGAEKSIHIYPVDRDTADDGGSEDNEQETQQTPEEHVEEETTERSADAGDGGAPPAADGGSDGDDGERGTDAG